jgi:hypothetical protein
LVSFGHCIVCPLITPLVSFGHCIVCPLITPLVSFGHCKYNGQKIPNV